MPTTSEMIRSLLSPEERAVLDRHKSLGTGTQHRQRVLMNRLTGKEQELEREKSGSKRAQVLRGEIERIGTELGELIGPREPLVGPERPAERDLTQALIDLETQKDGIYARAPRGRTALPSTVEVKVPRQRTTTQTRPQTRTPAITEALRSLDRGSGGSGTTVIPFSQTRDYFTRQEAFAEREAERGRSHELALLGEEARLDAIRSRRAFERLSPFLQSLMETTGTVSGVASDAELTDAQEQLERSLLATGDIAAGRLKTRLAELGVFGSPVSAPQFTELEAKTAANVAGSRLQYLTERAKQRLSDVQSRRQALTTILASQAGGF